MRSPAEQDQFSRTRRLIGSEALKRLASSRVALFGIGGVGGAAVEALARAGIGELHLVDNDHVELSNLNRQIIATHETLGRSKVEVAKERVLSINPQCRVVAHQLFFLPETAGEFDFASYDFVVDAVDTVTAKIALVEAAKAAGVPIISSMGTGNKLDPSALRIADVFDTSVDPLARVMRKELRQRGIEQLPVVYSAEPPLRPLDGEREGQHTTRDDEGERSCGNHRQRTPVSEGEEQRTPASISFVPPVAGYLMAGYVVRAIAGI